MSTIPSSISTRDSVCLRRTSIRFTSSKGCRWQSQIKSWRERYFYSPKRWWIFYGNKVSAYTHPTSHSNISGGICPTEPHQTLFTHHLLTWIQRLRKGTFSWCKWGYRKHFLTQYFRKKSVTHGLLTFTQPCDTDDQINALNDKEQRVLWQQRMVNLHFRGISDL